MTLAIFSRWPTPFRDPCPSLALAASPKVEVPEPPLNQHIVEMDRFSTNLNKIKSIGPRTEGPKRMLDASDRQWRDQQTFGSFAVA